MAEDARNQGLSGAFREVETPGRTNSETPLSRGMGTPGMPSTPSMMGTPGTSMGTPGIGTPGIGTPRMPGTPMGDIGTPGGEPSTPGFKDIGTPGGGYNEPSTPGFRDIGTPGTVGGDTPGLSREEIEKRNRRDQLREEAVRRTKRRFNMEKAKGARGRKKDRDISEKIALGQNVQSQGGEVMYDSRLFNRDAGLQAGFAQEDSYNIYDKPMASAVSAHIYRPTKTSDAPDEEAEMEKILKAGPTFQAHKGFKGSEEQGKRGDGPVQFEKIKQDDPFDLGDLTQEKERRRSREKESRKRRRRSPESSASPERRRKKKKSKKRKRRYD